MSAFDGVALPGKIPTAGSGAKMVSPENLFKDAAQKAMYQMILDGAGRKGGVVSGKIKKVKVEIFDMSNANERKKYEKLWMELLVKAAKNEVLVEHSKDLVKRPDGTSYWMKYVEYVEYESGQPLKKEGEDNER